MTQNSWRVLRGGSWLDNYRGYLRASARDWYSPSYRIGNNGFRYAAVNR